MIELEIRNAIPSDYPAVQRFYHHVIDDRQGEPYFPHREKDVYPTDEQLRLHTESGEMFLGCIDGAIVSAMALTQNRKQVFLHLLCTAPAHGRKGCAKQMLCHALSTARNRQARILRLDVLESNLPARTLYEDYGFVLIGRYSEHLTDGVQLDFLTCESSV